VRFGRVEGRLRPAAGGESTTLHFTAILESGSAFRAVRDEEVDLTRYGAEPVDLWWLADQLTQETLGNELALDGWEVIGAGDPPASTQGEIPRSVSYAVRNVS
jgi:hypothetical protein